MQKSLKRIPVEFKSSFFLMVSVLILIVPLRWILAWFMATAIHELFHYLAIRISGGLVFSLKIGARGIIMETAPLTYGKELFAAFAGPLGGLSLLLFTRWYPELAICAYVQSAFNLLPVYPLDGGRALRCMAFWIFPERIAKGICSAIEIATLIIMTFLGFYMGIGLKLGALPVAAGILLLFRAGQIKFSCKGMKQRVQ